MTKEFTNTWAVILGGSSGLGLATAKKLAAHGMHLCIVHRDRKSSMALFETEVAALRSLGVEVLSFNKDALSEATRNEVISQLPKQGVGVLVHSIAKGSLKPMLGTKEQALTKSDIDITIHAMGTSWYEWTHALIDGECFTKEAATIAFTSEGNAKVWPGYGAVSVAKATLEALMRQMAVELAPMRIRSNCIQAGTTQTPSFAMIPGSAKLAELSKKRNPFGRLTTPEDVANAVYLLCKEEARWINGAVLKVDGGESTR
jgi:NAD(P)-dependent dehydrogenase (short-subunit alcohol dehydrogenase family)